MSRLGQLYYTGFPENGGKFKYIMSIPRDKRGVCSWKLCQKGPRPQEVGLPQHSGHKHMPALTSNKDEFKSGLEKRNFAQIKG
ncbi:hypothetical protein DPMN_176193 [Dreissena polymorpha]|uniref:Uncharacterized protein n=1 Tax=Dreissena polymorpha TaxID=45954 RepID=A0A9D4IHW5_DREPO|nr:hypothetical protein DPMN_176193 [Dreissena polymorpha]